MMTIEKFLEQNIELIEQNKFTELYDKLIADYQWYVLRPRELTEVLVDCNINPLEYMTEVPIQFAFKLPISQIRIPETITFIGDRAFSECHNLTRIAIPDSVTSVDECAFFHCVNLADVSIGNGVTHLGDDVFGLCKKLTSIILPDTLETISRNAFFSCENMTNVTIGKNIKSIRYRAFCDCVSLQSIQFTGTMKEWRAVKQGSQAFALVPARVIQCIDGVTKLRH